MPVVDVRSKVLESPTMARDRLVRQLCDARGPSEGRLIVVRGMPGSGVSTVIRKLLAAEQERGAETAYVAMDAFERDLPYSAIDRIQFGTPWFAANPLEIGADRDVFVLGAELVKALTTETKSSRVIAIDPVELCDEQSALVLRYAVSRLVARGVAVVFGDTIARPTEIGMHFAELAAHSPRADLVTLADLNAADITELVRERAGVDVSTFMAERIRTETQGRLGAVIAYLSAFDAADFADLSVTRVLPLNTAARMRPHLCISFPALPAPTLVAAELCAVTQREVTLDVVNRTCKTLGVGPATAQIADGEVVQVNSLTGTFQLGDPLTAGDILANSDPARMRTINAVLADSTNGVESYLYRLNSLETLSTAEADHALDESAHCESQGDGAGGVRILETAMRVARGGDEYPRLLRAFGFMCIRNLEARNYQTRLGEFAVGSETDPTLGYMYCHFRTAKGHGNVDAARLRLAYLNAATVDNDHAFMQADIAFMHFLAVAETDRAQLDSAYQEAKRRLESLVDKTPADPQLNWIEVLPRLELLEAIYILATSRDRRPGQIREMANNLRLRAHTLPKTNSTRGDMLVLVVFLLNGIEDFVTAREVSEELGQLEPGFVQRILLTGQLATVRADLEIRDGRWAQARDFLSAALPELGDFDVETRVALSSMAAWLAAVDDQMEDAVRFLNAAAAAHEGSDEGHFWLSYAQAEVLRQQGDARGALEVLESALQVAPSADRRRLLNVKIELLLELEETSAAVESVSELGEYVDHMNTNNLGILDLHRGNVELIQDDPVAATALYQQALESLSNPFAIAKCRLALGFANERQRTHPDAALAEFQTAHKLFAQIGAKSYGQFTEKAAAYSQRLQSERFQDLSERERQVAHLAAQGWTNREIAKELSVSSSTVAFHVSNVLKKLGVSSRTEISRSLSSRLT